MSNQYALIDANNTVQNIVLWDGDANWQPEEGLKAIKLDPGTVAGTGWVYDGATFAGPAPVSMTQEDIVVANTSLRDSKLAQAALAIAPLQDAVDLGEATDAESALLKAWKQYRVAVNRIDLEDASPDWPTLPITS
ncbi:tail fiber assembly protein [Caballeronia sp. NCTM5]|uniref:tail fiber assembly protein n=1 Tax=Caballeronia sp. NCTM5 TaxID=2921755 RepID=UPI002542017F|nr:tail fiber assembly protein [Caballeronia sp. NCTM5]